VFFAKRCAGRGRVYTVFLDFAGCVPQKVLFGCVVRLLEAMEIIGKIVPGGPGINEEGGDEGVESGA